MARESSANTAEGEETIDPAGGIVPAETTTDETAAEEEDLRYERTIES